MEKEVTIDRLAFGGEGVGRSEGKVIFVPWTVPGDKVRVRILSDQGRFERAEVIEILEKSAERTDPPCVVFGSCGGCQWQQIKYDAQLRWKGEILRDCLIRTGKIADPHLLPILTAPSPWHYRTRIQLKVAPEGQIGFYALKSHRVVPFEECKIADPRLNEQLASIRAGAEKPSGDFELSLNGSGPSRFFTQVHPVQNERLLQVVIDFAFGNADPVFTKKRTLVELYAGAGNFTFSLAERGGKMIAVEENADAVREGQAEASRRGIETIDWIEGTAEWGLKKIYRRKIPVDILVLDPPRRGAREILDLIPLIRPRLIVYVSCDPVTLARDLSVLLRRYYRLEKVQPIDMFPQTYHIESVAQLNLL